MSSMWQVRRSGTDAKLGGVCGGLAARGGVDPVLIRVAAVLLALTGGIGLVLYLSGWLLVPERGRERSLLLQTFGWTTRVSRSVWLVLIGVACALVAVLLSPVTPFGFGTALVVLLVWYVGSRRTRARWARAEEATPPPATTPPDAYAAFLSLPDPVGLYVDPEPAYEPEPVPARPAPRAGRTPVARRLRLITLAVLGVVLAGLGIADASGVPVPFVAYASAALLVVGLALVAATWLGRARGLLPLALLLALTTVAAGTGVAATASDAWRHPDDFGRRDLSYATAASLPVTPDRLGTGTLDVDLSSLRGSTGTITYRAHVDSGRLQVRIPPGTGVRLRYDVGLGEVDALGQQYAGGTDLTGTVGLVPPSAGQPTLELELSVDRGAVQVVR